MYVVTWNIERNRTYKACHCFMTYTCVCVTTWWRHQMETFSALRAFCAGNSAVTGELPHKGQWRGALIFSLICAWINAWVNNRQAGDLRRHRVHYDVTVMKHVYLLCCLNNIMHPLAVSKIRKNIYRSGVHVTSQLRSFPMFTGPLFQTKLHLLSTGLLGGFQSSPWFQSCSWALISTELRSNFTSLVGMINTIVYETEPIFTDLGHGKLS